MSHIITVYGNSILESELAKLGTYMLITDPVPLELYRDRIQPEPERIVMPGTLEKSVLDEITEALPQDIEVVGIGGGAVIDAAKYFAFLRGKIPLIVPTITSSNAQFADFISVRKNGGPFGYKQDGYPKRVVVDFSLIQKSDPRWNRAGYGDLLYLQTTLQDWRIAAAAGERAFDPAVAGVMETIISEAKSCAAEVGGPTIAGLEKLMRLIEQSSLLIMAHPEKPISAGSEHLFAWNVDRRIGKHLIHGELVSLGMIISSFLQQTNPQEIILILDLAKVNWRPEQIGISWEEIKEALLTIKEYNREVRNFYTIYDKSDITPGVLEEIKDLLYCN